MHSLYPWPVWLLSSAILLCVAEGIRVIVYDFGACLRLMHRDTVPSRGKAERTRRRQKDGWKERIDCAAIMLTMPWCLGSGSTGDTSFSIRCKTIDWPDWRVLVSLQQGFSVWYQVAVFLPLRHTAFNPAINDTHFNIPTPHGLRECNLVEPKSTGALVHTLSKVSFQFLSENCTL